MLRRDQQFKTAMIAGIHLFCGCFTTLGLYVTVYEYIKRKMSLASSKDSR